MNNKAKEQLNKIDENKQLINQLIDEEEKIIIEESNSKELLDKFKKKEKQKIIKNIENRILIDIKGCMPKKEEVLKIKETDEFKSILSKKENENVKLEILKNAKSFDDIAFVSKKDKYKFIHLNFQNKKNIETYKKIDEQIKKIHKENNNINNILRDVVIDEIKSYDFENFAWTLYEDMFNEAKDKIENYFKTDTEIGYEKKTYNRSFRSYDTEFIEISKETIQDYLEWIEDFDNLDRLIIEIITDNNDFLEEFVYSYIINNLPEEFNEYQKNPFLNDAINDEVLDIAFSLDINYQMSSDFYNIFTKKYIIELLKQNKKYNKFISYIEYVNNEMEDKILNQIPDNYINLYPLARTIKRHFVLHVGPTNSGKTWAALNNLKKANNGIYLAPLRLLAFEKFEELNKDGYICSLKTGEEQVIKENANFISSTVEMISFVNKYDCAVIDECQMINDENRGGAWTNAILGLFCPEIHLCLSNNAKEILIKLIDECNDSYEIIEYERKNELICENETFTFPDGVKKGDALIVFSKKNVYAVAAELQENNIKCSIIYGALPYDVKQSEAEKFSKGETDVVVATDAIGMGLNLPIKRIVFIETEKFDGKTNRKLYSNEVKQIAGRAGRYGINEYGLYNVYGMKNDRKRIRKDIEKVDEQIYYVRLSFPETLINIQGNISDILFKWSNIETKKFYIKQNVDTQIQLSKELEEISKNKNLIFKFITIGFDVNNDELKNLWINIFKKQNSGKKYEIPEWLRLDLKDIKEVELSELEEIFKTCDLLYQYYDRFNYFDESEEIMHMRQKISKQMILLLKNKKISARRCSCCDQKLPFLWKYEMCENCYNDQYRYDYYDENENEDWYDDDDDWNGLF